MYKKFVEHRIRKHDQSYYCGLCKICLTTEKSVLDHLDSKNVRHSSLAEAQSRKRENEFESLTELQFKQLVENYIVRIYPAVYRCDVCNCEMQRLLNVFIHIKGQRHALNKKYNKTSFIQNHGERVKSSKKTSSVLENELSQNLFDNNSYFCNLCHVNLYCETNFKTHILGRKHKDKETLKLSKTNDLLPLNSTSTSSTNTIHQSKTKNLVEHTQSKKQKLSSANLKDEIKLDNLDTLPKKLPKNENDDKNEIWKRLDKLNLDENIIKVNSTDCYKCYICNVALYSDSDLLQHLKDPKHKHILSILPTDYVPFIHCYACELDIFEDEKIACHLNTILHKNQVIKKSENSQNQEILECFSRSKTIVDELCRELVKKTKKPNTAIEEKVNKITLHFNSEYSKMFIEAGPSNIFNIPEEKMCKLQIGMKLMFPMNDNLLCLICCTKIPNNQQLLYEHFFCIHHIQKLDDLINNDLLFVNYRDQFSDLTLAREFMKEVNNNIIFCFVCDKEIINDDNLLKKHIDLKEHHLMKFKNKKQLSNDIFSTFMDQLNNAWYTVQRFWCQVCNAKFEYEINFSEHLKGKKHLNQMEKIITKGIPVGFDICIPCASICLGHPDTYTKHCSDKMHKYLVKSKDYVVMKMNKSAGNLLYNIEEISNDLIHQSDAAIFLDKDIDVLSKSILETVSSHYPNAQAYIFGPRTAHLGFNDSMVEIFLDCGNAYNGNQQLSKSLEYLSNSQSCFETYPNVWDLKEILLKVKTPTIKVAHRDLGLNCDISFTNGLEVEKTKLIKLFITSYPPCRKMILFLKKWLDTCLQAGAEGLTTFGITWLVIFYLQQNDILPSIADLIEKKSKSNVIHGWETGTAQKMSVAHSSFSLKLLLLGFFKLYGNYDYRTRVISPLMGKSLNKVDFTDNRIIYLPKEMESYRSFLQSTKNPEVFRIDSPLCLQDPLDLAQNITRTVSKLTLRSFIQFCRDSEEILNSS